jgi:hypothetical protein
MRIALMGILISFLAACGGQQGPQVVIHNNYLVPPPAAKKAVAPATLVPPAHQVGQSIVVAKFVPPATPAARLEEARAAASECRLRILRQKKILPQNEKEACNTEAGLTPDAQFLRD